MLPAIVTHARVSFRHLDPEARQEAVQEVVCNVLRAYVRLVELRKTDLAYPTVLARLGVAEVKDHRKVGGKLNVLDISSTYCQQRKNVVVERLDHFDDEENAWLEVCLEDRHAGPAEVAATRMDFAAWLRILPKRLRRIAKTLAAGETTTVAAKKFKVKSPVLRFWLRRSTRGSMMMRVLFLIRQATVRLCRRQAQASNPMAPMPRRTRVEGSGTPHPPV